MSLIQRFISIKIPPTLFVVVGIAASAGAIFLHDDYSALSGMVAILCYIVVLKLAFRAARKKPL